jgi:hypothetical protein
VRAEARHRQQVAGLAAGFAVQGAMLPENGTEVARFDDRAMQETEVYHHIERSRNRIASDQLGVLEHKVRAGTP